MSEENQPIEGAGGAEQAGQPPAQQEQPEQSGHEQEQPVSAEAAEQAETEKKPWYKKRFDELTRQREEERRERLYWQQQAVEAMKRPQSQEAPSPAQDAPPKVEDFADYDEFIRAQARFEVRQEFKAEQTRQEQARRQNETQTQQRTMQQRVGSVIEKGKTTHEDFDIVAMNPNLPITESILAATTESEVGHEILYYLGQNPAEAQRIAGLSPYGQAKEIGKIEAKLTTPPPKVTTKSPPPVAPVGGNAPAGAEPDPAKDPEGWLAYERARVKALGRRY
jgi:hypothetical protein